LLDPFVIQIPSPFTFIKSYNACDYNFKGSSNSQIAFVCVDSAIDIYVTVRLVMILKRANKNSALIDSIINRKSKRTVFTAIIYWNFIRLLVAFGENVTYLVLIILASTTLVDINGATAESFFQCFFYVLMTYVVTADVEIVKVIEGKNYKRGSSSSESKKSYLRTSGTHMQPGSSAEGYSRDELNVSTNKLTFFKWINMIIGFHRKDIKSVHEFEQNELEEIIEGPSKAAALDLEKGKSTSE
ncbi:16287_t:CDS:1, partial [Acaulospora colombiana]